MYKEKSFQNLIDYWAKRNPDREAIFDGTKRITYGQLNEEIQRLAAALDILGVQKDDKVILLMPNWNEFIALYMAVAKLGAIAVPCNCALTGEELKRRIRIIKPKALFVSNSSQLSELAEKHEIPLIFTTRFKEKNYHSYSDLIHFGDTLIRDQNFFFQSTKVDPEKDLFAILFTSGSTGNPKGVQITPHNVFQSAKNIGFRINCSSQDTVLVPLPCGHAFGLLAGVLMPLFFGAKIVLMNKHRPLDALDLIEEENVTVHLGVPTMFIRELQYIGDYYWNLSSLRTGIVAGAVCSEPILKEISSKLKIAITNLYGSTEAMGISMTSIFDSKDRQFHTSGRVFEDVQFKVTDEENQSLGNGPVGELVLKSEGLMKRYYQMPEETEKVIDKEGWFHTGDLVSVDSSGYVSIVGRKKI